MQGHKGCEDARVRRHTVYSLTLAQSPMASSSCWQASNLLNYLPGLASYILAETLQNRKCSLVINVSISVALIIDF